MNDDDDDDDNGRCHCNHHCCLRSQNAIIALRLSLSMFHCCEYKNKKFSYRRDSARCHSRSLKVIRRCANRRGIGLYDFLLTLNRKLTSIFNLCIVLQFAHPYPSSLSGRTGKKRLGVGGHTLVSGCPEHWTIQS